MRNTLFIRFSLSILLLLPLVGCTYQHSLRAITKAVDSTQIKEHFSFDVRRGIRLPIDSSVYIAIAENVDDFHNSPKLSYLLAEQMDLHLTSVTVGLKAASIQVALAKASDLHLDFLIYPRIIIQQNKVSSFMEAVNNDEEQKLFGFDRLYLQLSVWDVNSKTLVDSSFIKGRSSPFKLAKNHTDDLFTGAMKQYAHSLVSEY